MTPTSLPGPQPDPNSVARLSVTLHRLDEAHRKYRVYAAKVVDISPTELSALLDISDTPGITPAALGRDVILSSGATTALIDRLERSGHIYRADNPDDRRSLHLRLTDKGTQTMTTLREAYRYVLSTTGTDETIASALPQLDSITYALNTAAREPNTPPATAKPTYLNPTPPTCHKTAVDRTILPGYSGRVLRLVTGHPAAPHATNLIRCPEAWPPPTLLGKTSSAFSRNG